MNKQTIEDLSTETEEELSSTSTVGHKRNGDWRYFTDEIACTQMQSARCKHCKKEVSYQKK